MRVKEKKVALVTGGSSGIGLAAVRALVKRGVTVYEVSRRDTQIEGATHLKGDVTNEETMISIVQQIVEAEGKLDILLCSAGFGISGAVEFTESKDAKRQFDVNFFGVDNCVKAVLPVMRKQACGRIVIVSSVAAAIAIPFQTYYSATKAALNAYACALRNELRPCGVTVTSVMPGDIATGFTDAREKSPAGDDEYNGRISRSVARMEKDERNGMKAEIAGKFLCRACLKRRVAPTCSIGFTYKLLVWLSKTLPQRLVSFIVYRMYAK